MRRRAVRSRITERGGHDRRPSTTRSALFVSPTFRRSHSFMSPWTSCALVSAASSRTMHGLSRRYRLFLLRDHCRKALLSALYPRCLGRLPGARPPNRSSRSASLSRLSLSFGCVSPVFLCDLSCLPPPVPVCAAPTANRVALPPTTNPSRIGLLRPIPTFHRGDGSR